MSPETAPIPFDPISHFPAPVGPGIAARAVERWRLWRQQCRWRAEMAKAASLGRIDDILNDIGLTRSELDYLVEGPADAGQQFEQLARMEHVDLRRQPAGAVREATLACAHCACRSACKRWLQTGIWQHDGDPRCPNAALLKH